MNNPLPSIHHAYDKHPASPIVLYLPQGPFNPRAEPRDILSQLASLAPQSTFVRVNYRFNSPVRFPTPIHDAVAGYDWVLENLVDSSSSTSRPSLHIGVCGELLGGSLAAMLALTECEKSRSSITSAYISSPILDWTFPDSVPLAVPAKSKTSKVSKTATPIPSWNRSNSKQGLKTSDLLTARAGLFQHLQNTLDPFASPLLFLRTPLVSYDEDEKEENETEKMLRITRVPLHHRRHPPSHSGLEIPRITVAVGSTNILYDQAEEFVRLLRRSVMNSQRGAGQRYLDGEEEDDAVTEAARIEAEKRIIFDEIGVEEVVKSMGNWAANLSDA